MCSLDDSMSGGYPTCAVMHRLRSLAVRASAVRRTLTWFCANLRFLNVATEKGWLNQATEKTSGESTRRTLMHDTS